MEASIALNSVCIITSCGSNTGKHVGFSIEGRTRPLKPSLCLFSKAASLSWRWQDGCLVSSLVEDQINDQLLEAENSCLFADSSPSRCSNGWADDSLQGKPAHNHDNHPEADDCQRDSWLLSAAICPVCSHRRLNRVQGAVLGTVREELSSDVFLCFLASTGLC